MPNIDIEPRNTKQYLLFLLSLLLVLAACDADGYPDGYPDGNSGPLYRLVTPTAAAVEPAQPPPIETGQRPEGWQLYWQNPRDSQPTIVHNSCPLGVGTETRFRIQPGQSFQLMSADCPPHRDQPVVRVRLQTDNGEVEGFAVMFESFEPHQEGAPAQPIVPVEPIETLSGRSEGQMPLMIDYRNYDPSFGNAFVYAWYSEELISDQGEAALQSQLSDLAQLPSENVTKMLMISSVSRLEQLLRDQGDLLRQSGVSVIGYNTENAVGTPESEMNALHDVTSNNPVARAAAIARDAGFNLIWGPIRYTADAVPDAAIRAMVEGGLDGVALQEQRGVESHPIAERVAAVSQTAQRYRNIGGSDFHVSVQIMSSRCPSLDECSEFVAQIEPFVDSIAIWASGPADRAALPLLVDALGTR